MLETGAADKQMFESESAGRKAVAQILLFKTERKVSYDETATEYQLNYGRKELKVFYNPQNPLGPSANMHIRNVPERSDPRPNETTLVYEAAYALLKELADKDRRPITYVLKTHNEAIREWADDETKGKRIFNWTGISKGPDEEYGGNVNVYQYMAIIRPTTTSMETR